MLVSRALLRVLALSLASHVIAACDGSTASHPSDAGGIDATVQSTHDAATPRDAADVRDAADIRDAVPSDTGGAADAELATDAGASPDTGVSPDLADFVRQKMMIANAPGLAALIIKNGTVAWAAGFGSANLETQTPVTPDTGFILASVSKTPIAIAMMQLVEQQRVQLDDDINQHLPFMVRNPNFPAVPITIRMLLTHSSSILDSDEVDAHTEPGDPTIALADFVQGYLTVGGLYYHPENYSNQNAPGTMESYSNMGASLAGFIVESVAGMPYHQVAKSSIFEPLGMHQTSYILADLDPTLLAMPYGGTSTGGYTPYGQYGFPDYPDGELRSSVRQLARFLLMFIDGGALGPTRILSSQSVDEIRRVQNATLDPDQGLIWFYVHYGPRRMFGHSGAYLGTSTDMYFDPTDGLGLIVLTNGDTYLTGSQTAINALGDIELRFIDEAAHF